MKYIIVKETWNPETLRHDIVWQGLWAGAYTRKKEDAYRFESMAIAKGCCGKNERVLWVEE
jgi:hypothetical protein